MTLGKSQFAYHISGEDQIIDIETTLKILGLTFTKNLFNKPHMDIFLKEVNAKILALLRIKRFLQM